MQDKYKKLINNTLKYLFYKNFIQHHIQHFLILEVS